MLFVTLAEVFSIVVWKINIEVLRAFKLNKFNLKFICYQENFTITSVSMFLHYAITWIINGSNGNDIIMGGFCVSHANVTTTFFLSQFCEG